MRILLTDDNPEICSALRLLIEQEPGLEFAAEVHDSECLLHELESGCYDILLLDWELSAADGANLLQTIRRRCPDMRIIALSGRIDARREALASGADAFISKGDSPTELLNILRAWQEKIS